MSIDVTAWTDKHNIIYLLNTISTLSGLNCYELPLLFNVIQSNPSVQETSIIVVTHACIHTRHGGSSVASGYTAALALSDTHEVP